MPARQPDDRTGGDGRERIFKCLLVPLDLSERNTRGLTVALALARQNRAHVILLHVIQQVADTKVSELRAFYRRLTVSVRRRLDRAARPFIRASVPVRTEICIGEPAREIVRTALKIRADLIVVSSHRVRHGRPATGWGTTSYKVGIFCRCPVLLIK